MTTHGILAVSVAASAAAIARVPANWWRWLFLEAEGAPA